MRTTPGSTICDGSAAIARKSYDANSASAYDVNSAANTYVCMRCQQHAWHTFVRSAQWFTLFFIPVIPLGKSTYATCNTCRFRQSVSNEQADQAFAQQRQMQPPMQPPHYG